MFRKWKRRLRRWSVNYGRSFSFIGLVFAALFFAASVTPSLLPRHYAVQGLLSGFSIATGYGVGVALVHLFRFLELPEPSPAKQWILKRTIVVAVAIVFVTFVWRMAFWQNSIRVLMEVPPLETAYPYRMALIAVVSGASLVSLGRIFARAVGYVSDQLHLILPRRIAFASGFTLVVLFAFVLANDLIARGLLDAADSFFARRDILTDEGVEQPSEPLACGSEASLVPWDSIGRQGKNYLSIGPTRQQIAAFFAAHAPPLSAAPSAALSPGHDGEADRDGEIGRQASSQILRPLRVYVGMRSSVEEQERATDVERAKLALDELKRVGGFERSVLIVATPTGTGWLDPSAVDTIEYLHRGDTAIVSMQYSYLPSWITLLVDPQRSVKAADALFHQIYGYWKTLPKNSRPKLYLHGLSLGALGSEVSADMFTIFEDPPDGAVWSGPPFPSQNWRSFVNDRNPASPPWLPTFRDGRLLRFTGQQNALDSGRPWGPMRNVYIQHASDPMIWFSPSLAWIAPEWLNEPRGPDVSPHLRWYPIITFLQVAFDMPMATSVPMGYGHNYAPSSYIDAWIAVTQPPGWDEHKVAALKALFKKRGIAVSHDPAMPRLPPSDSPMPLLPQHQ
ncbi:MAG: alpha/beta hydrolase [Novipirellula sp. JB048]